MKKVAIALSEVNENLMACPACQGTHVTLEGDFMRHFREEFQDNRSVSVELQDRCKLVNVIFCHDCQIQFAIVPDNVLDEKKDHLETKRKLAELTGILKGVPHQTIQ